MPPSSPFGERSRSSLRETRIFWERRFGQPIENTGILRSPWTLGWITPWLFGALERRPSGGGFFGALDRWVWSMKPPAEALLGLRLREAFFGMRQVTRRTNGFQTVSTTACCFLHSLRGMRGHFRAEEEVVASCGQRGLAEYSRSGQRTREDTTSLCREDVARTLNTA